MLKYYLMKILKIIIIFAFLSFIFYLLFLLSPTSLTDEKTRFVVPLDTPREKIISDLKSQNFIRSPEIFSFILTLKGPGKEIEPGAYMIAHNMNIFDLAETLLNHPYQVWIVLIPGLRVEQTGEKLAKKLNWSEAKKEKFMSVAEEGYMFPDTYLIKTDYTPENVAHRLISNFNEKFDRRLQKDLLAQNVRNDTAIKIASLIERESGTLEDKALIAGIIWNRLNKGMLLQIDATIQYIIGSTGNWWPIVKAKDLKIDSPYNTYIYKGLPPGPIASPSLASIKASVYPQETDCLYYLHSPDKKIHCSKTYEEHLENIEKYLQ